MLMFCVSVLTRTFLVEIEDKEGKIITITFVQIFRFVLATSEIFSYILYLFKWCKKIMMTVRQSVSLSVCQSVSLSFCPFFYSLLYRVSQRTGNAPMF